MRGRQKKRRMDCLKNNIIGLKPDIEITANWNVWKKNTQNIFGCAERPEGVFNNITKKDSRVLRYGKLSGQDVPE